MFVSAPTKVAFEREVSAIERVLADREPTERRELARLVGARFWGPGRFAAALHEAVESGARAAWRATASARRSQPPPHPYEEYAAPFGHRQREVRGRGYRELGGSYEQAQSCAARPGGRRGGLRSLAFASTASADSFIVLYKVDALNAITK